MLFLMAQYMYPYRKFCYVVHRYPQDTSDQLQAFKMKMSKMIPFDNIDYTFSYATNHGDVYCYIKLRAKDRKEVVRYLQSYNDGTTQVKHVITRSELKRSKSIDSHIGLILQDFYRENPEMTIEEIEQRLRF